MTDKEIKAAAKDLKKQRAAAFVHNKWQKILKKSSGEIPAEQAAMIAAAQRGKTVVINMNEHFHVLKYAMDNSIYQAVDRYSIFGNPFHLPADGDREHVCNAYENYFRFKTSIHEKAKALKGKVLGCHCKPLRCHGDYLATYAEQNG